MTFDVVTQGAVAPVAGSVKGKRVLVVGGTKGLGLAIAKLLLKRGAGEVTVAGRSDPKVSGILFVKADLSTVSKNYGFVVFQCVWRGLAFYVPLLTVEFSSPCLLTYLLLRSYFFLFVFLSDLSLIFSP